MPKMDKGIEGVVKIASILVDEALVDFPQMEHLREDLESTALLAYSECAARYDAVWGASLISYARPRMRGAIANAIDRERHFVG